MHKYVYLCIIYASYFLSIIFINFTKYIILGIGSIPDAVLASLKNHKDLGIHSEMFSDGVVDLVNIGCINNKYKALYAGKIVGSFTIGTRKLFDFMDNNPFVGK